MQSGLKGVEKDIAAFETRFKADEAAEEAVR